MLCQTRLRRLRRLLCAMDVPVWRPFGSNKLSHGQHRGGAGSFGGRSAGFFAALVEVDVEFRRRVVVKRAGRLASAGLALSAAEGIAPPDVGWFDGFDVAGYGRCEFN